MNETFLQQLRRLSVERAKNGFNTYDNQPITYWTTEIVGELGELCNMIKKMKRAENGGHDSGHSYTAKSITPKMLREEVGGTLIYIDLLCSILGIDLQEAITETFNEKSVELGFPYLLTVSTPPVSANDAALMDVDKPDGVYAVNLSWGINYHPTDLSKVMKAKDCLFIGTGKECADFIYKNKPAPVSAMEDGWVKVERDKLEKLYFIAAFDSYNRCDADDNKFLNEMEDFIFTTPTK